jgi:glycosyltransferase involved in cell wall biosynthesis
VRIHTRHCVFPLSPILTHAPARPLCGALNNALSTHVIATANAAAQNLLDLGTDPGRITVISNGVAPLQRTSPVERAELRARLNIPQDAFVIGIAARLEPCKGIDCLLQALHLLKPSCPDLVCLILGSGSQEKELRRQALYYGLGDTVRFLGFCENTAPYVNLFDLNVNCSRGSETASLSISEGMSLGIPVVASDFGGNPAMVLPGINGLLYPTDHPEALAAAIRRFHRNEAFRRRIGAGALARYREHYTAEKMTRKYEDLYVRAILERVSPAKFERAAAKAAAASGKYDYRPSTMETIRK